MPIGWVLTPRGNVDTDTQWGDEVEADAQGEDGRPQATGRGREQILPPSLRRTVPAHRIQLCCVSRGPAAPGI